MITYKQEDEAQGLIDSIKQRKAIIMQAFDEQTNGMLLNAKKYDFCKAVIQQELDELFHDKEQEAEEVLDTAYAQDKRQHERLESMGRA